MINRHVGILLFLTLFCALWLLPAEAAGTVFVADSGSDSAVGSAAAPFRTLARAAAALDGGGEIVLAGDVTLEADAELAASGPLALTAAGDARLRLGGNLYLGCDVAVERLTLDFRKSGAKIFCRGHNFTFGADAGTSYVGTAPAVYGGSYAGRAGETYKTLRFSDFSIEIAGGTWSALAGGSFRSGEGQPVGTVGGVRLVVAGGSFTGTAADAAANAVVSVTGFDALEGDGSLVITGGSFACGIFGVGRPGYNATVSNNQHIEGNLSVTVTGGSFLGGRIAAVQDGTASCIDGDFTLTVTGGSFAGGFGGFDGTGTRGTALADVAAAYIDAGILRMGFDDLVYLSAAGTGDGSCAARPAAKARVRGGKVVLLGEVDAANLDLSAQTKPLLVTGGDGGGALHLDGTWRAAAPLTLCNLTLAGAGTLSGGGHDLTLGAGIAGGAEIAILGGGTSKSGSYTVRVCSGTYKTVTGGPSAADATVSVCIEGGLVRGEVVCARGGNASLLVTGGEILGNLYAFSSHGGRGGIAVFGGKVHGSAAAAKSPRDTFAVRRFGCFGVAADAVHTDSAEMIYADTPAVFVCDGGKGDGSSPLSPLGDLASAVAAAAGGEVVLCGPLTVTGACTLPSAAGEVRITAVYRGVDFARTSGALLRLDGGMYLAGATRMYDLPILVCNNATYISAEGYPLILGEGLVCSIAPGRRVEKYPTVTGGSYIRTKTLRRSPCLTIKSGTWGVVSGGSYHPSASAAGYRIVGNPVLTVSGGRICTQLLVAGGNSLDGSAAATLAGGTLDCAAFALAAGTTVRGDVTLTLAGAAVCGEIDHAAGDGATQSGVYTLVLAGGDLRRLGAAHARAVGGNATAVLQVAAGIDLTAAVEGTATYQNPIAGYADPSVVYADGWYYYTYAKEYAGKPAVYMAKTANLFDIGKVTPVLIWSQALSGQAKDMEALWAPQLYKLDGKWYVYASCQFPNDQDPGVNMVKRYPYVWVAETDDPAGSYRFFGCMENLDKDAYSYLSPRVIEHDGNTYMFFSGFWRAADGSNGTHIQRMRVVKLESPTRMADGQVVISSPQYNYEKGIMEGPFPFYAPDGTLYLLFAAGHTRTDEYCTGMLRFTGGENDPLTDASLWKKYETPLQFTDYATGVYSPGAMIVTTSPDGKDFYGVFHAKEYHYSAYTMRRMYMQKIDFAADGTPTMTAVQPVSTTYTMALNPLPLASRITGFDAQTACAPAAARFVEADARFWSGLPRGDTDFDGAATLRDVVRTLAYLGGAAQADFNPVHADLDRDGSVTVVDALQILAQALD